ncbi:neutral/alkaline non-lysosomal ceramidase N-terminal domain-containing protein [bacterium]|nr:neutral/alkaline non-lysosomal ceramidase N-terminal domain-containing protein [bacterium]
MRLFAWVTFSVLIIGTKATLHAESPVFMAGAHTVDITPPIGLPMWGYGARHDRPAEGVLDPLEANAMVLAVGEDKLAFVGLDMGRPPMRKSFQRIREEVQKQAGVDYLFIVGSHTHHGTCIEIEGIPSKENSYVTKFENGIIEAIVQAEKKKVPAKWAVGRLQTEHRNRNRHTKFEPKPVDRELAIIRVDDLQGKVIGHAVNFAAHPTSIDAEVMLYSPDYPGTLKKEVAEKMGGVCLFLQGAAGDMSTDRTGTADYKDFGKQLGADAVKLSQSLETKVPANPSIRFREEELHFTNLRVDYQNKVIRAVFANAFFKELVDPYMIEYKDGVRPRVTVAIINDELGVVGGSGEFFCNHSLRLKERSRLPHTLFLGYCNDYQWYFPTIEAAAEGGYGADGTVSPSPVGAGEQIINRGLFHLYDLQNKFKGITLR